MRLAPGRTGETWQANGTAGGGRDVWRERGLGIQISPRRCVADQWYWRHERGEQGQDPSGSAPRMTRNAMQKQLKRARTLGTGDWGLGSRLWAASPLYQGARKRPSTGGETSSLGSPARVSPARDHEVEHPRHIPGHSVDERRDPALSASVCMYAGNKPCGDRESGREKPSMGGSDARGPLECM